MTETNIEQKALDMGWSPQEKWKGPEEKWVDAEEFVRRGEEYVPFLKKSLSEVQTKVEELVTTTKAKDAKIAELTSTVSGLTKVQKAAIERARESGYAQAKEDLKTAQFDAAKEGDVDSYSKLVEKEKKLDKEHLEAKKELEAEPVIPTSPEDKDFETWHKENIWYGMDIDMTAYAYGVAAYVRHELLEKNSVEPTHAQVFAGISEKVREQFPDKFANPNRQSGAAVGDGGLGSVDTKSKPKTKTAADLPQDAKDALKDYLANELGTEQQFIADYFEGEE